VLSADSAGSVLLVPPVHFYNAATKIADILNKVLDKNEINTYFPWLHIREHLQFCACIVRKDRLEITPPFLPSLTLDALRGNVKRVYLSATLTITSDFARVFGRTPSKVFAPDVDAGDGNSFCIRKNSPAAR
jgi:hypothetical protein